MNEITTAEGAAIIGIAAEESATTARQDQSTEQHLDYSNLLDQVLLVRFVGSFKFVTAASSSVVITEVSCSAFIVQPSAIAFTAESSGAIVLVEQPFIVATDSGLSSNVAQLCFLHCLHLVGRFQILNLSSCVFPWYSTLQVSVGLRSELVERLVATEKH